MKVRRPQTHTDLSDPTIGAGAERRRDVEGWRKIIPQRRRRLRLAMSPRKARQRGTISRQTLASSSTDNEQTLDLGRLLATLYTAKQ